MLYGSPGVALPFTATPPDGPSRRRGRLEVEHSSLSTVHRLHWMSGPDAHASRCACALHNCTSQHAVHASQSSRPSPAPASDPSPACESGPSHMPPLGRYRPFSCGSRTAHHTCPHHPLPHPRRPAILLPLPPNLPLTLPLILFLLVRSSITCGCGWRGGGRRRQAVVMAWFQRAQDILAAK